MSKIRNKIISLLLLFTIAFIWGIAFVFQVYGAESVPAFTLNAIRFLLGAISLLPVVLIVEHGPEVRGKRKYDWIGGCISGFFLFAASALQQLGVSVTKSSGKSGFLTGLYTVLIPIFAFLFFKHKTKINVWISAAITVVGLYLLCYVPGEGFSFGLGELYLVLGAVLWAFHVLSVDIFSKKTNALHYSQAQFFIASALSAIVALIFENPTWSGILSAKWSILYLGCLSVGVAYTLQVIAQKRADPTLAAIVLSLESVFSAIGGVVVGIDQLTVYMVSGAVLIFSGIVLSQLDFKRMKNKEG